MYNLLHKLRHGALALSSLCITAALLAIVPAGARAQIVPFTDFGPGNSFGPEAGSYCIGGNNPGCFNIPNEPAFEFTPSSTVYLTAIELALFDAAGGGAEGSAVVALVNNNGGLPGSSVLEQWTITPGADQIYTLDSVLNPLLSAGTQYWLLAANTLGAGGVIGWNEGLAPQTGPWADMGYGSWVVNNSNAGQGAFEIQGSATDPAPEPASLAILCCGLLGIAAVRVFQRSLRQPNSR